MKKYRQVVFLYFVVFAVIIAFVLSTDLVSKNKNSESIKYNQLLQMAKENKIDRKIDRLEIHKDPEISDYGKVIVFFKDGTKDVIYLSSLNNFMDIIIPISLEQGFIVENIPVPKTGWLMSLLPSLIMMIVAVFLFMYIFQQVQGGGGSKAMSFGKSKAKLVTESNVKFKDVAGLLEEKEELEELVDFLKQPKKFRELGARIPKGVLLVGPPGTGKTLLAKAVAGEAGVPFFNISGSDFVELYVGIGASRVRDLFEQAKRNSPCIIFIDEIDAVGRRRGAGLGGGHDEREQTLNQLLVEMDGFGINEGVIVVAATNRADILDPAILRPGRFDRQVVVGRPDVKGREEILQVHAVGKPLAKDVDLKVIAQTTAGFTGADLENLLNESALLAARANKKVITMEELRKAFVKVGIGTEKKSRVISEKEKKITAYHEAGHAIIHECLEELDSVHSISIIPTGSAGGYTMPLPGEDRLYLSKKYMLQEIVAFLGGRAAEHIIMDDITTGASNDIERASNYARNMVMKYGMSNRLGPILYGNDNDEVFLGRDIANNRNYGENIATAIDEEVRNIIDTAYEEAIQILEKNMELLHQTSKTLIEKEKLNSKEFKQIIVQYGNFPLKEKSVKGVTLSPEENTSNNEI